MKYSNNVAPNIMDCTWNFMNISHLLQKLLWMDSHKDKTNDPTIWYWVMQLG
jgi:hypothetical protein